MYLRDPDLDEPYVKVTKSNFKETAPENVNATYKELEELKKFLASEKPLQDVIDHFEKMILTLRDDVKETFTEWNTTARTQLGLRDEEQRKINVRVANLEMRSTSPIPQQSSQRLTELEQAITDLNNEVHEAMRVTDEMVEMSNGI